MLTDYTAAKKAAKVIMDAIPIGITIEEARMALLMTEKALQQFPLENLIED